MRSFIAIEGIAAPLPIRNVDTDKIVPARYLKGTSRRGLGEALFADLRKDAGFVLDVAPWDRAAILVALDNFGCGSSREHAPWALRDFGITCVIAISIADIFYGNCIKNGILPVQLPASAIDRLMDLAGKPDTARFEIDLPTQTVAAGGERMEFAIDGRRKDDLLSGRDEIASSLLFEDELAAFERDRSLPAISFQA